ncbi:MAG: 2-oxoglutarate dehydrogenase complex dihydrolipoyllysine-residue succinyltransferase [Calditrichaeota bacterium]|nr:2-oxoglutarate dehydrogenase complex dihydrolipoyllysine-residue succinyltransferase [Calditrichota bacterium]
MLEVKVPSPGESVNEVTISQWLKADGSFVEMNDELFEIESEKATLSVSAESSGVLKIVVPEGATVQVGTIAAKIDDSATAEAAPAKSEKTSAKAERKAPAQETSGSAAIASPAAEKILREAGVSPSEVANGSGRGGRVTKEDALRAVTAPRSAPVSQAPAPAPAPAVQVSNGPAPAKAAPAHMPPQAPKVAFTGERIERREKMTNLRQKVAERLVSVRQTTAMLTTFNEVDMSALMQLRKEYKDKFQETYGVRLGFMSFFTKAVTEALRYFPAVNAFIEKDEIVYHDYVDMGIAVQAPKGLVVPVVRNAESLSLWQIEAEIERLAGRARNNQLTIDEMTGGTYTISNGGVFGSLMSTPILNPPQSAILGMHKIEERPIALNGQVVIRPMMYVAMSYDHRIIDGRESVGFLVRVKESLENPVRLLLQV